MATSNYETVTIPTTSNPYRVIVNGVEYKYEAGATVEVPPEVAAAINASVNAAGDLVKPGEVKPPFDVSGGSGGVTSWNDLSDRPFGEETSVQTIAEGMVTSLYQEGADNYWNRLKISQSIPLGTEVTCTLNGEQYTGVLTEYTGTDYYLGTATTAIGFGNPKIVLRGPEDTGENYFVKYSENDIVGNYIGVVLINDFADQILKVDANITTIKTLDTKYLPEPLRFGVETEKEL